MKKHHLAHGKAGRRPASSRGFSLVELALALGVMSFCILVLVSLVPIGLNSYSDSRAQTLATNIATTILADLTEVVRCPKAAEAAEGSPLLGLSATNGEQTLYFDRNGVLTTNVSSAAYTALLTLAPPLPSALPSAGITGTLRINWPGKGKERDGVTVFIGIPRE